MAKLIDTTGIIGGTTHGSNGRLGRAIGGSPGVAQAIALRALLPGLTKKITRAKACLGCGAAIRASRKNRCTHCQGQKNRNERRPAGWR
jgi:DnaJ-class molecular chaperone